MNERRLTTDELASLERYARKNDTEPDGSQSQLAAYVLMLVTEVRESRAIPALPEDVAGLVMKAEQAAQWLEQDGYADSVHILREIAAALESQSRSWTWQPISTVSKGPKAIQIWCPKNRCSYTVTWEASEKYQRGWHIFGGGWRETIQHPSHWMPLPEPPAPIEPEPRLAAG